MAVERRELMATPAAKPALLARRGALVQHWSLKTVPSAKNTKAVA